MSATVPWGNRPIKQKIYGPRIIPVGTSTGAGSPGFIQIDLPAWAIGIAVTGDGPTVQRFALVPRAELPPDGSLSLNTSFVFFPTSSNGVLRFGDFIPRLGPFRTVTMLNYSTTLVANFGLVCILTDIPRDAMPELTADNGIWATYNGISNDPT